MRGVRVLVKLRFATHDESEGKSPKLYETEGECPSRLDQVPDGSAFLKITTKKRPAVTPAMPLLTTRCQWVGGDKIEHLVHYISALPLKILNGFF